MQPHFWLKEVQSRRCRKKLPVLEQYRIWYKILKILVVTTRYMVYNRARDVGPGRRIRRELSAVPGIFAMAAQKETQRLWNRPIITAKGRTSMQFWTLPRPSRGERSGRVWIRRRDDQGVGVLPRHRELLALFRRPRRGHAPFLPD